MKRTPMSSTEAMAMTMATASARTKRPNDRAGRSAREGRDRVRSFMVVSLDGGPPRVRCRRTAAAFRAPGALSERQQVGAGRRRAEGGDADASDRQERRGT